MVERIRSRSISVISDGEYDKDENTDIIIEKDVDHTKRQPLSSSSLLPPQHPEHYKYHHEPVSQHSPQAAQQRETSSNTSSYIHAPCNVIIDGLKIEVTKCHATINELQCKLEASPVIKCLSNNDENDYIENNDTSVRVDTLEFENIELRRLLSEAVFRSQALEKQLEEIPQDITVAMAEKRVLETKLAHALRRGDASSPNPSKKNTHDEKLLEEYQLTIHQLTLSLEQMKTQQLENEKCKVVSISSNRRNGDTPDRSEDNVNVEKENIDKSQQIVESKKKVVQTDIIKLSKTNEYDDSCNREKSSRVKASKTSSKSQKSNARIASTRLSEGLEKETVKATGTKNNDALLSSESKLRRGTRISKGKAASSSTSSKHQRAYL